MAWSWLRRRADRPSGPAPAATAAAGNSSGPPRETTGRNSRPSSAPWNRCPPSPLWMRSPLRLAAHQNPSFLAPLGHRVDPDGPGGLVTGLASVRPGTPIPYAASTALAVPARARLRDRRSSGTRSPGPPRPPPSRRSRSRRTWLTPPRSRRSRGASRCRPGRPPRLPGGGCGHAAAQPRRSRPAPPTAGPAAPAGRRWTGRAKDASPRPSPNAATVTHRRCPSTCRVRARRQDRWPPPPRS